MDYLGSLNNVSEEAEVEEELDGFEDFTLASPWERFTAGIEAACRHWAAAGPAQLQQAGAELVVGCPSLYSVHHEQPHGAVRYLLIYYFQVAPSQPPAAPALPAHQASPLFKKETIPAASSPHPSEPSDLSPKSPHAPAEDDMWRSGLHRIQLWFGVTDFLVLLPMTDSGVVRDMAEASLLLSTISVALSSCDSQLAAFVPVYDPARMAYTGFQHAPPRGAASQVNFRGDRRAGQVPPALAHMDGLYDLFASKLAASVPYAASTWHPHSHARTEGGSAGTSPGAGAGAGAHQGSSTPGGSSSSGSGASDPQVRVSVRTTYRLAMPGYSYRNSGALAPVADEDGMLGDADWAAEPWDATCPWSQWHSMDDPVKGFELVATWRNLAARSRAGMAELEKLPATSADAWSLHAILPSDSRGLEEWMEEGFGGRLRALLASFRASPGATFMDDFSRQGMTSGSMAVPPPTATNRVLDDLFNNEAGTSDERGEVGAGNDSSSGGGGGGSSGVGGDSGSGSNGKSRGSGGGGGYGDRVVAKTAPPESLFARLCLHTLRFGTCNIRSIAKLWSEFVREVQWHWEESQPLPRVATGGPPDVGCCLLHQKLQMLALCIERKNGQQKRSPEKRAKAQQQRRSHTPQGETRSTASLPPGGKANTEAGGAQGQGVKDLSGVHLGWVELEQDGFEKEQRGEAEVRGLGETGVTAEEGQGGATPGSADSPAVSPGGVPEGISGETLRQLDGGQGGDGDRDGLPSAADAAAAAKATPGSRQEGEELPGSLGRDMEQGGARGGQGDDARWRAGLERGDVLAEGGEGEEGRKESEAITVRDDGHADAQEERVQDVRRPAGDRQPSPSAADAGGPGGGGGGGEAEERHSERAPSSEGTNYESFSEGDSDREVEGTPDEDLADLEWQPGDDDMAGRRGALAPVGPLMMLTVPRQLYAPVTQEAAYVTEDMLHERQQALALLGSNPTARDKRARVQGDMLASDMAAFKAANPGAVLEDFVRWHSPRDWLPLSPPPPPAAAAGAAAPAGATAPAAAAPPAAAPLPSPAAAASASASGISTGAAAGAGNAAAAAAGGPLAAGEVAAGGEGPSWQQGAAAGGQEGEGGASAGGGSLEAWPPRGRLSGRMQAPGNLWVELWSTAAPVPSANQKPLFDHVREAEKVLHYLETLQPQELLAQMLGTSFTAAAHVLRQCGGAGLPPVAAELRQLDALLAAWLDPASPAWAGPSEKGPSLEGLCAAFERAEASVVIAASLWQKLSPAPRLVEALLAGVGVSPGAARVPVMDGRALRPAPPSEHAPPGGKLGGGGNPKLAPLSERELVAGLFTPENARRARLRGSAGTGARKRVGEAMGNELNGHEPFVRELVLSTVASSSSDRKNGRAARHAHAHALGQDVEYERKQRMYVRGTSEELQIGLATPAVR